MLIKSNKIYFPNQITKSGYIEINDGIITNFYESINEGIEFIDYSNYFIIPGFIDQHIHGWGSGSFNNDKSEHSIMEMKRNLPYEGVTSFLATSGAESIEGILEGIINVGKIVKNQKEDGATLLGVHLEGPFINKEFKGMQKEEYCIDPNLDIMNSFLDAQSEKHLIKLMTMAPELPNSINLIKLCKKNNIQINIGHSAATFDCITKLKEYGLGGVTHMFSGMKGLHHREPGVVGAALYYDDLNCEFAKQTGMTVRPEVFELTWRMKSKDRIIMTTDCGGIALNKKERYHYIRKETFIPHPEDNTLIIRKDSGEETVINIKNYEEVRDLELSYIKSIQNMIKNVTPTIHEVVKVTSENPAKYIGVFDKKGSLDVGKDADFLVMDDKFNIQATYCMGKKYIYGEKDYV